MVTPRKLPFTFHPLAAQELLAAAGWYAERDPVVAERFKETVQRAIDHIRLLPEAFPIQANQTRRYILANFPFSVIYRLRNDAVEIIAVAHHRRRPGYWRKR